MPKKSIYIILAVVLFIMALIFLNAYIEQQRNLIKEQAKQALTEIQANQTPVLIAKGDIPRGAKLGPDMLKVKVIPNQFVEPNALTSLDRASDMIAATNISKDEQITFNKLVSSVEGGRDSLAMVTPIGKRAVTISVGDTSSVAGMVKPGDRVDVIGTLPVPVQLPGGQQAAQEAAMPLFQNILVLAVEQQIGRAIAPAEAGRYQKTEEKKAIPNLITLALSPQEASFIAFVQEQGKISLVLRSPADSEVKPVAPASWDTLFQYVLPQEGAEAGKSKSPERTVEIFRGGQKEVIPLEKR